MRLKVNKVDGYIFLKPLIFYSKNDLIQYCNKNNYISDIQNPKSDMLENNK